MVLTNIDKKARLSTKEEVVLRGCRKSVISNCAHHKHSMESSRSIRACHPRARSNLPPQTLVPCRSDITGSRRNPLWATSSPNRTDFHQRRLILPLGAGLIQSSAPISPCVQSAGAAMMLIIVWPPFFFLLRFTANYLSDSRKTQPPAFRVLSCFLKVRSPLLSNALNWPGPSARSSRHSASDVEPYSGRKFAGFSVRLLPLLQEVFHLFEKIRRKHIRAGYWKPSFQSNY